MSDRARRAWRPDVPGRGSELELDRDESRHLLRVLRLRPGDPLRVFDGRGGEWEAVLTGERGGAAVVRIDEAVTDAVEARLRVALHQALCRPERVEWALQKGTEIGVASFHIFRAERSEGPDPSAPRWERWRRIVLEACKQSGRRVLPEVVPEGAPDVPDRAGLVLDPGPDAVPLGDLGLGGVARIHVVVGPEGGLTDAEVRSLEARGCRRASLGPRTLRTETAGVVASALILHRWGDLGSSAPAGPPTVDSTESRT